MDGGETRVLACYLSFWLGFEFYKCENESVSTSVVSDSLPPHGLQPTRLLCPWDFPGKNMGVGCHVLLQGIFLTQGWSLRLLHLLYWQADYLTLSHQGSPDNLI